MDTLRFNRLHDDRSLAITRCLSDAAVNVKAVLCWKSSERTSPERPTKRRHTIWAAYGQHFAEAACE